MKECYDCGNGVMNDKAIPFLTKEGKLYKCPVCYEDNPGLKLKQRCECYTRIVGYLRPVASANKGKQAEIKKRKMYRIDE